VLHIMYAIRMAGNRRVGKNLALSDFL